MAAGAGAHDEAVGSGRLWRRVGLGVIPLGTGARHEVAGWVVRALVVVVGAAPELVRRWWRVG